MSNTGSKCEVCNKPSRGTTCVTCIYRADDVAFERNLNLAAAIDFLKRDRSEQIQRSRATDIATMKYISRHSHPIISNQLVFAPNITRRAQ